MGAGADWALKAGKSLMGGRPATKSGPSLSRSARKAKSSRVKTGRPAESTMARSTAFSSCLTLPVQGRAMSRESTDGCRALG